MEGGSKRRGYSGEMVITACALRQNAAARGLVLTRHEPTMSRHLEEGRGIMNLECINCLRLAKDNIDRILYLFDDSKAGGSISQQLGGISLELLYILEQVEL